MYVGLLTVIEWPKDSTEPEGAASPRFERDVTRVYLVTSRDGISIDTQYLYAHQPLLPTGATQGEWNVGFVFPAAQLLSSATDGHRVYFEARANGVRHEQRFSQPAAIGMAQWQPDRMVGLRAAYLHHADGEMTTKSFRLLTHPRMMRKHRLAPAVFQVNADVHESARLTIHLLNATGAVVLTSAPLRHVNAHKIPVSWVQPNDESRPRGSESPYYSPLHRHDSTFVRLRFVLRGNATLYAWRLHRPDRLRKTKSQMSVERQV